TPDPDHASLAAECGKGTYIRSLARDLGRALGTYGHVLSLRRGRVGPFGENELIPLEQVRSLCHRAATGEINLADALLPVETALDDIPALAVSPADAARIQRGQGGRGVKPYYCADGTLPLSAAWFRSLLAVSS